MHKREEEDKEDSRGEKRCNESNENGDEKKNGFLTSFWLASKNCLYGSLFFTNDVIFIVFESRLCAAHHSGS